MRVIGNGRSASAWVVVPVSLLLGGCFGVADRASATAGGDLRSSLDTSDAQHTSKVVKPSGSRVATAADTGLPAPSEIFDFHPRGSKPDTWRQPFVIDPNDGPLAGYGRRVSTDLRQLTSLVSASAPVPDHRIPCRSDDPLGSASTACGENAKADALSK